MRHAADSALRHAPAPAPAHRRVAVILNARSGVPGKETVAAEVERRLAASGLDVALSLIRTPSDLREAVARAADGDADLVVAGGGDGTVATVASAVLGTSKTLAVLPLGTFNYFAQRVGVPSNLEGALDIVTSGRRRAFTVGDVNGRVFLNNASIGLYPAVLRQRESAYRRVGRSQAAAYLAAAFALVQPPALLDLRLQADGREGARRTPLLFVGVNAQQLASFGVPGYDCLERDQLAAYITRPLAAPRLWRLAARGLVRGLHGAAELEVVCARELQVTLRRRRVRVAMDGEVARLRSPLRFRLHTNALHVLAPAAPAAAPAE